MLLWIYKSKKVIISSRSDAYLVHCDYSEIILSLNNNMC